jgi:hypothetical protein
MTNMTTNSFINNDRGQKGQKGEGRGGPVYRPGALHYLTYYHVPLVTHYYRSIFSWYQFCVLCTMNSVPSASDAPPFPHTFLCTHSVYLSAC